MLGSKKHYFVEWLQTKRVCVCSTDYPAGCGERGIRIRTPHKQFPKHPQQSEVFFHLSFEKCDSFLQSNVLFFVWVVSVCETSSRYWIPPRGPLTRFDKGFLVASMTVRMSVSGGRVIALVAELCGTLISTLTTTFLLSLLCTITSTKKYSFSVGLWHKYWLFYYCSLRGRWH